MKSVHFGHDTLMTDQYFLKQFALEFIPQQIDYEDV